MSVHLFKLKDADVQAFLEEATVLDPRFKTKLDKEEIWDRVREAAVAANSEAAANELSEQGETQRQGDEEGEEDDDTPAVKQSKRTALEELFEEEDRELIPESMAQRVHQEVQLYRSLPSIPSTNHATLWWWHKRDTLSLLSGLAESYLCVQASSSPSERVFSTAGDTISPERSRILPEKADMLIFLHKNCL
ncbi:E3 SUMO-protein ligase ZBED1-like [Pseudoliparis swirei]|uniref:E3 SUMO-protein ligase ZBED1-like n=1 Tax=Pseudoliparis swirei TaxID=2059687 RepID=UPI0024BEC440|nr:E3 SUMO-protein ligase ZBED1-like [Pseudoliparis swirei]